MIFEDSFEKCVLSFRDYNELKCKILSLNSIPPIHVRKGDDVCTSFGDYRRIIVLR